MGGYIIRGYQAAGLGYFACFTALLGTGYLVLGRGEVREGLEKREEKKVRKGE